MPQHEAVKLDVQITFIELPLYVDILSDIGLPSTHLKPNGPRKTYTDEHTHFGQLWLSYESKRPETFLDCICCITYPNRNKQDN